MDTESVDELLKDENYFFLDFVPYYPKDSSFLELEEYFENRYLKRFAEKIERLALKLIYYYPCEIYLLETTSKKAKRMKLDYEVDIRKYSPAKLGDIIRKIITLDFTTMNIVFTSPHFLMQISGYFSVGFYGVADNEELKELIRQLAMQEGLFFKQHLP